MSDVSRIEALIRDGVPFDLKTDGPGMLVSAAWMNKLDIMNFLLDRGVDPNEAGAWNKRDRVSMKPLVAATVAGHDDGVQLLLDRGAKVDDQVMRDALGNRRVSIVKIFWDHGNRSIPPLTYAVSQGAPVDELEKIVAQATSAKPGLDFGSALDVATSLGNFPAVQFLAEKWNSISGQQPATREFMYQGALTSAASEGQDVIVDYLIKQGAKPNWAALMSAAGNATPYNDQLDKEHFEKTVQILIAAGALNGISEDTAAMVLQSAIFTRQGPGNLTVVKMLLDQGLSLEARGKDGKTPMQVAQENYKRTNGNLPSAEMMAFLEKSDKK
jgi:ankyrin repeat protein